MRTLLAMVIVLLVAVVTTALGDEPFILVYPSGDAVPENLLRIELRFSRPVFRPLGIDNIKLVDSNGIEIKDAFLDLPLPSPDFKRVTILLHPGRVKSGVGANLALGRALHAGETITLVISHPTLTKSVRKTWRITAFDAEPPQPVHWTLEPPQVGIRSPLLLHLDKPISSSAETLIAVRGPDGGRLAGDARLENSETVWRFVPVQSWGPGNYTVVIHPELEDCAGNRRGALFEAPDISRVRDYAETVQQFALTE